MDIDVEVPLPNVLLSKTTGHTTSNFQNYRLGNKLPQELGEEMDIIISNTVKSKISLFLKFIWELQHQREFVTTVVRKPTIVDHLHRYKTSAVYRLHRYKTGAVYRLHRYKTGAEFLIVLSLSYHRLPQKN